MNSLRQFVSRIDRRVIANESQGDHKSDGTIHILCVGEVDRSYVVHDLLLGVCNLQLSIVTDYRELWVLPKHEAIHLFVIHNTLSLFELEEACRFIRQQWSQARILVVRSEGSFLEDELYDERVAPAVVSELLLSTIERLTGELSARRSGNA